MADDRRFDETLSRWLEETAPPGIPERVLTSTFQRTRKSRQHVGWRALLGRMTMPRFVPALGSAAVIVVAAALALSLYVNRPGVVGGSPSPTLSASPGVAGASAATPTQAPTSQPSSQPTSQTSSPPTSGGMWPQPNATAARDAQERADAGDPEYAWQVDPALAEDISHSFSPDGTPILTRFFHEVLGWDSAVFNTNVGWEDLYSNLNFVRCAPAGSNTLYADDERAGGCAPTIDELTYETVSIDLGQPVREGPTGIWVVTGWAKAAPFVQSDPRAIEASATARLETFLDARVAGEGAEGYVDFCCRAVVFGGDEVVPLLYGTTAGAPYERYEIDVVGGPYWPFGELDFEVRLFADDGATVVEQPFIWRDSRLLHDRAETTENGEPVAIRFEFLDGQVTLSAARPWEGGFERSALDFGDPIDVSGSDEAIVLVGDPVPSANGCTNGPIPADAEALALALEADPDLQVTASESVTVNGIDALVMDVVVATGAVPCDGVTPVVKLRDDAAMRRWAVLHQGSRMRLYLFDMPPGSVTRIVAIAVVAPDARFETVMTAATPVVESIVIPGRGE